MLIQTENTPSLIEFKAPSQVAETLIWIVFLLPVILHLYFEFSAIREGDFTIEALLAREVGFWLLMGVPVWILTMKTVTSRGPLSRWTTNKLSRFLIHLPGGVGRTLTILPSTKEVILDNRFSRERIAFAEVASTYLREVPRNPGRSEDFEDQKIIETGLLTKRGICRPLGQFFSYSWARQIGEVFSKNIQCPMNNMVTNKIRQHFELDVTLGEKDLPDPGPPPPSLKDKYRIKKSRKGFKVVRRTGFLNILIGLAFGAFMLLFSGLSLHHLLTKDMSLPLFLFANVFGFLGFWIFLFSFLSLFFAYVLEITSEKIIDGLSLLGFTIPMSSISTANVEEVLRQGKVVEIISDEASLLYQTHHNIVFEESRWLLEKIRWMIGQVVK